jgi:hypothetical protein
LDGHGVPVIEIETETSAVTSGNIGVDSEGDRSVNE